MRPSNATIRGRRWNGGCHSWRISAPTGNTAVECRQIRLRATSPSTRRPLSSRLTPPRDTGNREQERDVHRILIPAGLYFSISPRFLRPEAFTNAVEILTRLRGEMRRNVERAASQPTRDSVSLQSEIRPVRWQDDAAPFNNTRVTFRFSPASFSPQSFFLPLFR